MQHNGVVHEHVLLLRVLTDNAPRIEETGRIRVEALSHGFRCVELRFGFAEKPDVPSALTSTRKRSAAIRTSLLFLRPRDAGAVAPAASPDGQERIYAFLTRNAVSAPDYFVIRPTRVVELGTKAEM